MGAERKPTILLRADAGKSIGYGHFVRTCALAGYLAADFDCRIASFNPDGVYPSPFQKSLIREAGARTVLLAHDSRGQYDAAFLEEVRPEDITVLDNYYYSPDYQTSVRKRCKALVCIDDMHDRHFTANVVMTFCPLEKKDFSLEPYTEFYGGLEWSFLREPFLKEIPADAHGTNRIAVAMGGADPLGLTRRIIALVRQIEPDSEIDVLAGDTVEVGETEGVKVWRGASAEQIAGLFDRARIGIFPASTVCVEAMARQLPVAAGHFTDNQEEFYAHGVAKGWFRPLGCLLDSGEALSARLREALKDEYVTGEDAPRCIPTKSLGHSTRPAFIDFAAQKIKITTIFKSLWENA